MNFILDVDCSVSSEKLGAKAAALSDLQRAGLPVPPWFVLSSDAFCASARDAGYDAASMIHDDGIAENLRRVVPNAAVRASLTRAVSMLGAGVERVAVRSSMRGEDGRERSFAGQFESHLGVPCDAVADRIADVWRSAFAERAARYRASREIPLEATLPAVLVQSMIYADASGIAFSADPMSCQRGVTVIAAVHGLGCALASGMCEGDEYRVDRAGRVLSRSIAQKEFAYRVAQAPGAEVQAYELSHHAASSPVLDADQVRAVAELARRCEHHFGVPQDIEWAIAGGELYLLQSRPITSLASKSDPDGCLAVWDNSNIAESYSGVTTPLTFSFVRFAYSHVYRELCRIGGVPESMVEAHERALRSMIGLVRGRIHYNLLSWYRLLALTPGFRYNRALLDDMLGLREEVAGEALDGIESSATASRLRRYSSMIFVVASATLNHLRIRHVIERFYRRVDSALESTGTGLEDMRADELVEQWFELVRRLLRKWDAPLINDYLAMFFHGALGRLVKRWFPDGDCGLANALLQGERAVISVEPVHRLLDMAALVRSRPRWIGLLRRAPRHVIERELKTFPELDEKFHDYLVSFGDRCLDELKLESATLNDDPLPMLRAIGELARGDRRGLHASDETRAQAERRVREALRTSPVRHVLFKWILRNARARVRDRENLRFQRTRVFGRVRRVFVELGRRFYALNLIDDPRDVFYLEVDEVVGFVEGTATSTDLRGLVRSRKAEFARYEAMQPPDERFETRGIVHHGHAYRTTGAERGDRIGESDTVRVGQPGSSGRVRGRVRIVEDPRGTRLSPGEILVAERTDPGWVVLFSGSAGLLVEHGSLLSHSAIVARELGIPTVIGIDRACKWLNDGDWIELDGDRGTVTKLGPEHAEHAA